VLPSASRATVVTLCGTIRHFDAKKPPDGFTVNVELALGTISTEATMPSSVRLMTFFFPGFTENATL
jgi:hypothetical protein